MSWFSPGGPDEWTSVAASFKPASTGSTINYTYDHNGNLTSDTTWTQSFDYNNRLVQSAKTGTTLTYGYDVSGSRVRLTTPSKTTLVPTGNYSLEGSEQVKYIQAGAGNIATIRGTGILATPYHLHTDHLGSSSATTNTLSSVSELSDYYPYGSLRLNEHTQGFDDRKGYTGLEYDVDTGLNYAVNRYYNSAISRFISQDPVFLALGNEGQIKQLANQDQTQLLSDPQLLNSYAYARNNPLRYTDPDGLLFKEAWHGTKNAWNNSVVWVGNKAEGAYQNNATARWLLDHPESGLYVSIGASLAAEALTVAAVAGISTIGTRCLANCSQFGQESGAIVSRGWGNPKSLNQHYSDHGGDFGSKSANDYANKASNFFNEAPKNGYQQIVGKDGTIRIYDGKTNTFGSYNTDGSTKTFFKPSGGQSYWNTQTSDPQKNVKLK